MALSADLYLDHIKFDRYCEADKVCTLCKVESFEELVERIRRGEPAGEICPHWPRWRQEAFTLAVKAGEILPSIPPLEMPRPGDTGLLELNAPGAEAILLVTGNSELTQSVILAVVSLTASPLRVLFVDTKGHTVDMAMIFKEFTTERILAALEQAGIEPGCCSRLILPGLAKMLAPELAQKLNHPVEAGPVCIAELPLYLGEDWIPAAP